jgi:hypothetical protein
MRSTCGYLHGGHPFFLIKVYVIGFFFCEDGDLPKAGPSSSDRSDEFWKAPSTNVTMLLMPGVC